MESLISLVVLGVVYSVIYVVKSMLSRSEDVVASPMTGEAFPQVDVLEPSDDAGQSYVYEEPKQSATTQPAPVQAKKKEFIPHKHPVNVQRATPDLPPVPTVMSGNRKENRFNLSGKSEARRAFIYSEIFNRKYK